MNADVEKAVEALDSTALAMHRDWNTVKQSLRDQEVEIVRLRGLLGECYAISGADTDGEPPERYADIAVQAVKDLRQDYDDVLDWQDRAEKAEALLREVLLLLHPDLTEHTRITAHLGAEQ